MPSGLAWVTVWTSPLSAAWTPSCEGFVTTRVRSGWSMRAAAIDQSSIGRPATGCSTFGSREFIRTPLPAARTTTVTRGSGETGRLDPADALARMGGIVPPIIPCRNLPQAWHYGTQVQPRAGLVDAALTARSSVAGTYPLLVAPPRLAAIERWFLRAGLFLLPLAYWWGTFDRYVLPKLLLARVLVIGLLILFVARAIVMGSLTIRRTRSGGHRSTCPSWPSWSRR